MLLSREHYVCLQFRRLWFPENLVLLLHSNVVTCSLALVLNRNIVLQHSQKSCLHAGGGYGLAFICLKNWKQQLQENWYWEVWGRSIVLEVNNFASMEYFFFFFVSLAGYMEFSRRPWVLYAASNIECITTETAERC